MHSSIVVASVAPDAVVNSIFHLVDCVLKIVQVARAFHDGLSPSHIGGSREDASAIEGALDVIVSVCPRTVVAGIDFVVRFPVELSGGPRGEALEGADAIVALFGVAALRVPLSCGGPVVRLCRSHELPLVEIDHVVRHDV